jgi:TBC1 domain-containing protein 4
LESQVRSLEVSVATMGHFIESLAESNSNIEIPGEIRRVVAQLSVAEHRRSIAGQCLLKSPKPETALQTAMPITISEDSSRSNIANVKKNSAGSEVCTKPKTLEEKPRDMPYPLKSALSSPNLTTKLSGMSSFFASTHSQIKQQRLNAINNLTEVTGSETVVSERKFSANSTSNGSASTRVDMFKSCPLPDVSNYEKSTSVPLSVSRFKLKSSQSSFYLRDHGNNKTIETTECESRDSGNVTPTSPTSTSHIHPLDSCSDVHFTYGGTTKLKTIRPLRAQLSRNSSTDSIQIHKPMGPEGEVNVLASQIVDSRRSEMSAVAPIAETKESLVNRIGS